MAKTKPIGVRFDEEILEKIKTEQKLTSPQKVLNYLMENYHNCVLNTEKGITVINPSNGLILQDFPNPEKPVTSKPVYQYPLEEKDCTRKIDNSEIQKQINAIRSEKIPKERDTLIGRLVWASDRDKRIKELRKQLK